jgi:hypothetical protein
MLAGIHQRGNAAMTRRKGAHQETEDPLTEEIYAQLAARGFTVDRNIVDPAEAKRVLATFGVTVCRPYGHLGKRRYRGAIYSSNKIEWGVLEDICQFIEAGGSARKALAREGMPGEGVFFAWVGANDAVNKRYARARETRGVLLGELIEDASLDLLNDDAPSHEKIAALRVVTENLKWVAARLAPKDYGDPKQAISDMAMGSFIRALERVEASKRTVEEKQPIGLPVIDIKQAD